MRPQTSRMRWGAFVLLVAVMHFAWELAHSPLFASMQGLPVLSATLLCARATLGDLVITAFAFVLAAVAARSFHWPAKKRLASAAAVFVLIGIAVTAGYEIFAIRTGRWQYSESMPTIFGIGLSPLLQWLLLPLVEIAAFRFLWRPEPGGPV
ncbi:MAG TPA: hypothetical protein VNM92_12765 [Thermoanaerobaculia bacterium]|nr:hypothetical protein [Thermoanaerobaculia bacterium]